MSELRFSTHDTCMMQMGQMGKQLSVCSAYTIHVPWCEAQRSSADMMWTSAKHFYKPENPLCDGPLHFPWLTFLFSLLRAEDRRLAELACEGCFGMVAECGYHWLRKFLSAKSERLATCSTMFYVDFKKYQSVTSPFYFLGFISACG